MKAPVSPIRIRTFYPADPVGVVPGGVDTFIRGILKFAPTDLEFSLVGMTTDPVARPVGRWTRCCVGRREFDFFPVVQVADAGQRTRLPLSVRFTAGTVRHLLALKREFDAFEFHRVEPALLFLGDDRPKNAFFHQDMGVIRSEKADILWRHMPGLYFSIERRVVGALSSAWCVREEGVRALQNRFPAQADLLRFIPTWVDTEVFSPPSDSERQVLRSRLAGSLGISERSNWVISVGRLDRQKDPELLLAAIARLVAQGHDVTWLIVGDGVLRSRLEKQAAAAGVSSRLRFLGLCAPVDVAGFLKAADVFALSSAYEGMPMAALEALGSGLPVATTDVGEVRKVVMPGVNGQIAQARDVEAFARCLAEVVHGAGVLRGDPAVAAIAPYQPAQVLAPVFENYRRIVLARSQPPATVSRPQPGPDVSRTRGEVLGVPIDALCWDAALNRLQTWAQARESRYVCICNVHSVVTATQDPTFLHIVDAADMATPDGAPVAWTLRRKGFTGQERINGPDLMWRLCAHAQSKGLSVGLYGATSQTLESVKGAMTSAFPALQVGYAVSPPFRPPTAEEDSRTCSEINASGVGVLFVGLGCPKQERWMASHRGRISAVMIGVGAAFDYHAGTVARAPRWMQDSGLEWLHRLVSEPRRLWRRYLITNTVFVWASARELVGLRRRSAAFGRPGSSSSTSGKP